MLDQRKYGTEIVLASSTYYYCSCLAWLVAKEIAERFDSMGCVVASSGAGRLGLSFGN